MLFILFSRIGLFLYHLQFQIFNFMNGFLIFECFTFDGCDMVHLRDPQSQKILLTCKLDDFVSELKNNIQAAKDAHSNS